MEEGARFPSAPLRDVLHRDVGQTPLGHQLEGDAAQELAGGGLLPLTEGNGRDVCLACHLCGASHGHDALTETLHVKHRCTDCNYIHRAAVPVRRGRGKIFLLSRGCWSVAESQPRMLEAFA